MVELRDGVSGDFEVGGLFATTIRCERNEASGPAGKEIEAPNLTEDQLLNTKGGRMYLQMLTGQPRPPWTTQKELPFAKPLACQWSESEAKQCLLDFQEVAKLRIVRPLKWEDTAWYQAYEDFKLQQAQAKAWPRDNLFLTKFVYAQQGNEPVRPFEFGPSTDPEEKEPEAEENPGLVFPRHTISLNPNVTGDVELSDTDSTDLRDDPLGYIPWEFERKKLANAKRAQDNAAEPLDPLPVEEEKPTDQEKGKGKEAKGKGKNKGKGKRKFDGCYTCGGNHFARHCPKGKGKGRRRYRPVFGDDDDPAGPRGPGLDPEKFEGYAHTVVDKDTQVTKIKYNYAPPEALRDFACWIAGKPKEKTPWKPSLRHLGQSPTAMPGGSPSDARGSGN